MNVKRVISLMCAVAAVNAVSGCSYATKEDIASLRSEIADVRKVSEQSLDAANEARQMAQDSNSRTMKVEEAVNRSFRKSMYK